MGVDRYHLFGDVYWSAKRWPSWVGGVGMLLFGATVLGFLPRWVFTVGIFMIAYWVVEKVTLVAS